MRKAIKRSKSPKQIEAEIEEDRHEFDQQKKAKWSCLVPQITYVLLRCDAKRRRASIYQIAEEDFLTYPNDFFTWHAGRRIPDLSLVLLTLDEAKKREWGYIAGNWFRGWRLTKKGLAFARDVERRRKKRK
jgi:hypothetical protein